jgi:Schlafen, AlbA_2
MVVSMDSSERSDDAWTEPWTLERLQGLDDQEHDFQEFKSSLYAWDGGRIRSDFLDNLSKQASAFANGSGGNIFLGIDDHGRCDGGVPRDLKPNGTREWLEDVIPNLLDPPLKRFNVYEVAISSSVERATARMKSGAAPAPPSSDAAPASPAASAGEPEALTQGRRGRAVYVLEIPTSEDAPHQARDRRYYLRIAGKSRPMSHRHVLDILHRVKHPEVVVDRIDPYGQPELIRSDPRGPLALLCMRATLTNKGRSLAQHVGCEFTLPRFLVTSETRRRTMILSESRLMQRPGEVTFFFYHPIPIFPSQEIQFGEVWIAIHGINLDHFTSGRVRCRWRVFADGAPSRQGHVDLEAFSAVQRGIQQVRHAIEARSGPS